MYVQKYVQLILALLKPQQQVSISFCVHEDHQNPKKTLKKNHKIKCKLFFLFFFASQKSQKKMAEHITYSYINLLTKNPEKKQLYF